MSSISSTEKSAAIEEPDQVSIEDHEPPLVPIEDPPQVMNEELPHSVIGPEPGQGDGNVIQDLQVDEVSIDDDKDDVNTEAPEINLEIVEHLFKVCPPSVISKFRLVSKEWNEASMKPLRELAVVRVSENKKHCKGKTNLPLNQLIDSTEDADDFLKLSLNKDFHYHKYSLESWYLTWKNPNMVKFFDYFSPSITYLELCNLRVDSISTLEEILYGKIPNCVTLILDRIFVKTPATHEVPNFPPQLKLRILKVRNLKHFPVEWIQFFNQFPNIQDLEATDCRSDTELDMILTAISSIRLLDDEKLAVKKLAIIRANDTKRVVRNPIADALKDNLVACHFPLEELHLKMGCKTFTTHAKGIMEIWADRLKRLKFHIDFRVPDAQLVCTGRKRQGFFPYGLCFPQLETLEIVQWCRPYPFVKDILKAAPALKSLRFSGTTDRNVWRGDVELLPHGRIKYAGQTDLTEFEFPLKKLNLESFKSLPIIAPNLTKLDTRLDDAMFRVVCKELPNLVEIKINSCKEILSDQGITGLSENPQPGGTSSADPDVMPNIKWLIHLRVFVLRDLEHLLTSKSVFHGFLRVPQLFTLRMCLPPGQISNIARQALEDAIPNLEVLPNKCSRRDQGRMPGKESHQDVQENPE